MDKSAAASGTASGDQGEKHWYLVYTKPRQEQLARLNLDRQGYETYLPLVRELRRRLGRRQTVVAPMFPRYLFVHLDRETDNWGPIRSTLGVVSVVRFGQEPARTPTGLIDFLRRHEDAEGIHSHSPDEYRPGSRVRVVEGQLMGFEGVFLAKSSQDRVVVLLEIMGKEARTTLDAINLEPIVRG
jgi:transcriptional antiterminator RfaH